MNDRQLSAFNAYKNTENWRENCENNFSVEIFDCLPTFAVSDLMKQFNSSKILLCGSKDLCPLFGCPARKMIWLLLYDMSKSMYDTNPYRKKQQVNWNECRILFHIPEVFDIFVRHCLNFFDSKSTVLAFWFTISNWFNSWSNGNWKQ